MIHFMLEPKKTKIVVSIPKRRLHVGPENDILHVLLQEQFRPKTMATLFLKQYLSRLKALDAFASFSHFQSYLHNLHRRRS